MGLSVNVINAKGMSIYYKQDISSPKKETIKKIKAILAKVGGDIQFNDAVKDLRTERSGDGYSVVDNNGNADHKMDMQGVMIDIYGALHISVKDSDGKTHTIYLDRLTEDDITRLADTINQMHDNQKGFTVIPENKGTDELDKVHDENDFSSKEGDEYSQRSTITL